MDKYLKKVDRLLEDNKTTVMKNGSLRATIHKC